MLVPVGDLDLIEDCDSSKLLDCTSPCPFSTYSPPDLQCNTIASLFSFLHLLFLFVSLSLYPLMFILLRNRARQKLVRFLVIV